MPVWCCLTEWASPLLWASKQIWGILEGLSGLGTSGGVGGWHGLLRAASILVCQAPILGPQKEVINIRDP